MKIIHETGRGAIELSVNIPMCRVKRGEEPNPLVRSVAVQTWKVYGDRDIYGRPIHADSIGCILKINDVLNQAIERLHPCILLLSLDDNTNLAWRVLDSKWLRFKRCAITKSDSLPEDLYINYLEEMFCDEFWRNKKT